MKLDEFTEAYIEALLWTCPEQGTGDMHWTDIEYHDLEDIVRDCAQFQKEHSALLSLCGSDAQNGHDFALTRNRHGAGFWGRGYGKTGEQATEACRGFGESELYLGDDGRLYLCGS